MRRLFSFLFSDGTLKYRETWRESSARVNGKRERSMAIHHVCICMAKKGRKKKWDDNDDDDGFITQPSLQSNSTSTKILSIIHQTLENFHLFQLKIKNPLSFFASISSRIWTTLQPIPIQNDPNLRWEDSKLQSTQELHYESFPPIIRSLARCIPSSPPRRPKKRLLNSSLPAPDRSS